MAELVVLEGLAKRYGQKTAVDGVSGSMEAGRIVGLAGSNGAGKSSLLRMLADVIRPSSGSAQVQGIPVGPKTHGLVAYMPDASYLPARMNMAEAIRWFGNMYRDFDTARAHAMCETTGLSTTTRFAQLSKGYAERAMMVLCLGRTVPLYLMDEPMAGADPAAKRMLKTLLLQQMREDCSMVVSTHLLNDMEALFDEVVFMREGRFVARASADDIREGSGKSIDSYYNEVMGV